MSKNLSWLRFIHSSSSSSASSASSSNSPLLRLRLPLSSSYAPKRTKASCSAAVTPADRYMALTEELSDAMKASGVAGSLPAARALHAHLVSAGLDASLFLQNHLLNTYLCCDALHDARRVFASIPSPNVFSRNIMINGLSKFGSLREAVELFEEMPMRDSTSWNTLMAGFSRSGQMLDVVNTFVRMVRDPNCKPNMFTFACAMKACGSLQSRELGLQLHGFLEKLDFGKDVESQESLIEMYAKCGAMAEASKLFHWLESPDLFCWNAMLLGFASSCSLEHVIEIFDKMPERDVVSWNTVVSALSRHGRQREALSMFMQMQAESYELNSTSYTCALSACAGIFYIGWGRHLHAHIIRSQKIMDVYFGSAMVDMYAKCGHLEAAKKVFHSLPEHNTVSWTALIAGHAQYGHVEQALMFFNLMRAVPMTLDQFTLATVLSACCTNQDICLGAQLHSLSFQIGYCSSVPVSNALVTMYAKCGSVQDAESIFDSMPVRDIISWTSMITAYSQIGKVSKAREYFENMNIRNVVTWNAMLGAYVQHGIEEEGLKLFIIMKRESAVNPDWVTFATVFRACGEIAAVRLGSQLIAYTVKVGFDSDTSVANGIITMHSRCGRILEAREIFDHIKEKDLVSWNAMITAYAQHGLGVQAIETFQTMLFNQIKPDYISYVSVLSGCGHSGLVEEGRMYFDSMTRVHNISPGLEHYACMVDLLSRAGYLEEAKNVIDSMKVAPSAEIWGALLGACKIHGNSELAETAMRHLCELDSMDSGGYVLLAKIYEDAGRSDESARVRKLMRERGIKKNPGCSWVEVKNTIHVFTADDINHPDINIILEKLDELIKKIEAVGYVKNGTSKSQIHHSEKLAVAFGLISLPESEPIYIMKNLRVCSDCHTMLKLTSLVTMRELIVRDANRFHHFRNGSCSCGDYW